MIGHEFLMGLNIQLDPRGGGREKEIPWVVMGSRRPRDIEGYVWVPIFNIPDKPQQKIGWTRKPLVRKELSVESNLKLAPVVREVIVPSSKPLSLHHPKDIGEPRWDK